MTRTGVGGGWESSPQGPGGGVLQGILFEHLETFLARIAEDPGTPSLPAHVERELRGFLTCGVLAHGFCRFHCFTCGVDALVAFSCKGRGFCPSCGGRRMAECAAHLVDQVLPDVPVRQWVITFPWRLRYLLSLDAGLCRATRKLFLRAVLGFYSRKARTDLTNHGRSGAVVQIQRFGSALNLNLHFHALVLDGVYTAPDAFAAPRFHPARPLTSAEVARLLSKIRSRLLRLCRRRGLLGDEGELDVRDGELDQGLLPLIHAASIQGRAALDTEAGCMRLGIPPAGPSGEAPVLKELCAELDGFSLHAAVRVPAGERSRLEHLCRHVARPLGREEAARGPLAGSEASEGGRG